MYDYHPEVTLLLVDHSDETVELSYSPFTFHMPLIGLRPPFYTNPRYEPYFPVI